MASVSATFRAQARATLVATWATSRAWVSLVRWWSSGKTKTWVFPARRRNAVAWRMRSLSRSKQVRHRSGSSGRARRPPPSPWVAPGASWSCSRPSRAGRSSPGRPTSGPPVPPSPSPTEAWLSAWAKVIPGPPWPAMVDAHRRFLSLGPGSRPASGTGASCSVMGPVCPKGVTLGAAGTWGSGGDGQLGRRAGGRRQPGAPGRRASRTLYRRRRPAVPPRPS